MRPPRALTELVRHTSVDAAESLARACHDAILRRREVGGDEVLPVPAASFQGGRPPPRGCRAVRIFTYASFKEFSSCRFPATDQGWRKQPCC